MEDAKAKAREAGGSMRGDHAVWALPLGTLNAWVDQMGIIRWEWAEGADRLGRCALLREHSRGV